MLPGFPLIACRRSCLGALFFLLALLGLPSRGGAAPAAMVPDEVIIRFKPDAAPSEMQAILEDLGATRVKRFRRIRAEEHRISRYGVGDAVNRYKSHRAVEFIEPNWIVRADNVPDDPLFNQQWGLHNTGQTGGTPGADIRATSAWDVQTGSPDVVVAIIDSGTDYTHPDLAANVWTNRGEVAGNGLDDDRNGFVDDVHGYDFFNHDGDPMDDNGHGTHVAGTIAAVTNNGVGVAGVAWNVKVMPLKFLDANGFGPVSAAIECLEYATLMGVAVMNNSWGGTTFSAALRLAIEDANEAGILFVAAAGNSGQSLDQFVHFPASFNVPNVIAVASTTPSDALSSFSNFGATTVHLAAPGSNILSTYAGGLYQTISGTSMAVPHVSGALALLRSQFPEMPGPVMKTVLLSSADPIPALAGLVITGGRLNAFRMLAGADSIPPGPIQDLSVAQLESNRITLRWTASGDNGSQGRASRYDVRFALAPIDEATFDSASVAISPPFPGQAGSAQEFTLSGLDFLTTYFFALKAIDEYGNVSPISNVASGRTLGPPDIALAPLALDQALTTGQSAARTLTVTNEAGGTLDFRVEAASPPPTGTVQASMILPKGAVDPRVGDPVADGHGGPDRFGHHWIDSDEPGGPPFSWMDISAVGQLIPLEGDDAISPFVPIGFLFPFYDNLYAFVRVCTNGFLSFSSSSTEFSNQFLPSPLAPANVLAPFWDDLIFISGSTAHAYADGERFVVQWSNVARFGGGGPYTFQVILDHEGAITYQYLFMGSPSTDATVGIQNASRDDGLTIAFNTSYVHGGLAVRIATSPRWLSVSPLSGRLGPGESLPVTVRFDASELPGGDYEASVRIQSNDPDESLLHVPVHMVVTGAPDIAFAGPSLAFLNVFVGATETQPLLVTNRGVLPLEVTDVRATPAVFEVEDAPFTLGPGESRELDVRFRPGAPGTVSGILTVLSNDPDEGAATVTLTGSALLPPDIAVDPSSLAASLFTGETATRSLAIRNVGASDLSWRAFIRGGTITPPSPVTLAAPAAVEEGPDGARGRADQVVAPAGAVQAELADLTGVRILFDAAHGSAGLGPWTNLVRSLTLRGAAIAGNRQPFTPDVLNGFDVLWLTDLDQPWTLDEVSTVRDWVRSGGSLLIEGDNPPSLEVFNSILSAMGAGILFEGTAGASGPTVHVEPHVTTRGVSEILLSENLAILGSVGSPASVLIEDFENRPNTAYSIVGSGKILAMADEVFSDFHSSFADNHLFANQAFDWLGGVGWIQVTPASGVVRAGGEAALTVALDAGSLPGADHTADVVLVSNDPDEAEVPVPFALHVTAAPDIALSRTAFDYGPVFVGASRSDTLRIVNQGTAVLSISGIEAGDPDFWAEVSSLELLPGERRDLILTFTPTKLGGIQAAMGLRSNDPDEGEISLSLSGAGLEAPDVEVSPTSWNVALRTGEQATRTLTVSNRTGSDLEFEIELKPPPEEAAVPEAAGDSTASGPGPASTRAWHEYRDRPEVGATATPAFAPSLVPLTLPVVVRDPPGDAASIDLLTLRAGIRSDLIQFELELAADVEPANFGGFLSLDLDQSRATGQVPTFGNPNQDIGAEFELELFSLAQGIVTLQNVVLGTFVANYSAQVQGRTIRFAVPLAALADDELMDVTGVIGNAVAPTDWFPDRGHGRIGGVDWLAAEPARGRLPAGEALEVALTFDAGSLDGGPYDAQVIVASNDPDESRLTLSAHLDVTAAPVLSVDPASIDFGAPYLGTIVTRNLSVFNVGSDPLTVSGIEIDDPSYAVDPATFTLAPHSLQTVTVRFQPATTGDHATTLSLTHNAAGSPRSVPLRGTGVPPPRITASPATIRSDLETGDRETQALTLGNAGESDLEFTIGSLTAAAEVVVQEALEVPRGTEDPRRGDPVALGMGGPDRFGYRWTDSDEAGGPAFQWVEISQIGTRIPIRDLDQNSGPLPIGFEFPFYGGRFSHFNVCTHGWVSFTSDDVAFTNQPLPSPGAPENLLAAFWEDLNFFGQERAFFHYDGTRLVIQYTAVSRTEGGGPYTFQILLYPTGTIVYQYLTMPSPTNGATIGIQNGARDDGLQIAFNAPYVRDNLAIRISAAPAWLGIDPISGRIPPAGSTPIQVTTDASGLFPGDFPAKILVKSNDPVTPELGLPVLLHVVGVPELAFSPPILAFDTLFVGESEARPLRLTNLGTDRLDVTQVSVGLPGFAVTPTAASLAPLQSVALTVTFTPVEPGEANAVLSVLSNDPDSPASIPVRAVALVPPRIGFDRTRVVAAALPGGQRQKTLRVQNSGGSDLRWSAAPARSGDPPVTPEWLSVEPVSGVVAAGGATDLLVTFDAETLEPGDFEATIPFSSNDPASGGVTVEFVLHVGSVDAAAFEVDPNALHLGSNGNWITARVELPEPYDPGRVVPSTVKLLDRVSSARERLTTGDFNGNDVPDLELKFDRAAVETALPEGDRVEVVVTGEIEDVTYFVARQTVRVLRPRLTSPNGGEVTMGSHTIRWLDPEGRRADHADLAFSPDGGQTWSLLARAVTGNAYAWTLPGVPTGSALVRVYVYDEQGAMGYDTSDGPFTIRPSISGVETEEGFSPTEYALRQNAPNPFNPATTIRFDMPVKGKTVVRVFGIDGRLVREWSLGVLPPGRHRLRWDGRDGGGGEIASGVYFCRIEIAGSRRFEGSRRMMVVK